MSSAAWSNANNLVRFNHTSFTLYPLFLCTTHKKSFLPAYTIPFITADQVRLEKVIVDCFLQFLKEFTNDYY